MITPMTAPLGSARFHRQYLSSARIIRSPNCRKQSKWWTVRMHDSRYPKVVEVRDKLVHGKANFNESRLLWPWPHKVQYSILVLTHHLERKIEHFTGTEANGVFSMAPFFIWWRPVLTCTRYDTTIDIGKPTIQDPFLPKRRVLEYSIGTYCNSIIKYNVVYYTIPLLFSFYHPLTHSKGLFA